MLFSPKILTFYTFNPTFYAHAFTAKFTYCLGNKNQQLLFVRMCVCVSVCEYVGLTFPVSEGLCQSASHCQVTTPCGEVLLEVGKQAWFSLYVVVFFTKKCQIRWEITANK